MLIENTEFNAVLRDMADLQKTYQSVCVKLSKPDELNQKPNDTEKQIINAAYAKLFEYYNAEMESLYAKLLSVTATSSKSDITKPGGYEVDFTVRISKPISDWMGSIISLRELIETMFPEFPSLPYTMDYENNCIEISGIITESQMELCKNLSNHPLLDVTGTVSNVY